MGKVLICAAIGVSALPLAACGGSRSSTSSTATMQREAELYEIDQIERTWHEAASKHDLDLMMTIWANDATLNYGGRTYTGKTAIRKVLAAAGPFQPQNDWVSDTPAFKIRTTVSGDVGTLYFQCHYVDRRTHAEVATVGADQNVKKIGGRWLITSSDAATTTL